MLTAVFPRLSRRLLLSGLTLAALSAAALPTFAADPLSYVFVSLDNTGLADGSLASSAGGGYAVGVGSGTATGNNYNAFAWNLSTNARQL